MMLSKEEAEEKWVSAPHESPKKAYGRGYLRALHDLQLAGQRVTSVKRAGVRMTIADDTVDEFLEMAKSDGIAAAEKWFKTLIKHTMDRALLGTREDTMLLLESYISDVKAKR